MLWTCLALADVELGLVAPGATCPRWNSARFLKPGLAVTIQQRGARPPRPPWLAPSPATLRASEPVPHLVTRSAFAPPGEGAGWQRPGRVRSPSPTASIRLRENGGECHAGCGRGVAERGHSCPQRAGMSRASANAGALGSSDVAAGRNARAPGKALTRFMRRHSFPPACLCYWSLKQTGCWCRNFQ